MTSLQAAGEVEVRPDWKLYNLTCCNMQQLFSFLDCCMHRKDNTEQLESYKEKLLPHPDAKDKLAAMYLQTDHINSSPSSCNCSAVVDGQGML